MSGVVVRVDLNEKGDRILLRSRFFPGVADMCKEIPGANWSPTQSAWTYPLSLRTCRHLRHVFAELLIVGERLGNWARVASAEEEGMRALGQLRDIELERVPLIVPRLAAAMEQRTYQRVGAAFMANQPDGGVLLGNAYMEKDFPCAKGMLATPADRITGAIRAGHRLGWRMATHVTGDAGTRLVLDAVEAADRDRPIRDARFTLIHSYFPNDAIVRRAAALGVCVDTQTAWYYKDAETLRKMMSGNGKILGRKRTGANAMEQRMLARAVKRARYMALLPYVSSAM